MRYFYKVVGCILDIRVVQRMVIVMFRGWKKGEKRGVGRVRVEG